MQIETEVFRETSRNLPSLYNTLRNGVEVLHASFLSAVHMVLFCHKKQHAGHAGVRLVYVLAL